MQRNKRTGRFAARSLRRSSRYEPQIPAIATSKMERVRYHYSVNKTQGLAYFKAHSDNSVLAPIVSGQFWAAVIDLSLEDSGEWR